jgi:DNA ligase-1
VTHFTPTIFKRDTSGKIRFWRAEVDPAAGQWRSQSGIEGGTTVESGWSRCEPKSRPTAGEQAIFEAEAELGKKLEKDYSPTQDGVDDVRDAGPAPMLAHKFEGWDALRGAARVFTQPKLDGIRCKVNRHGMWTRTGKPILGAPHVFGLLTPVFAQQPDFSFDGELYNHDLKDDFNKIVSIVRKSKPTDADIALASKVIQYHIYDLALPGQVFSDRNRVLDVFFGTNSHPELVAVDTAEVTSSDQLDRAYQNYLQDGYEGQMVRLEGDYEHKRSKLLLKRKEFETEEFELVSIEEGNGNWAGLAKRVVFKLKDGRTCGGGIRGSAAEMKALLERADTLVGTPVTIRFFTPTPDGMPRFPVAIDFNRPD